jgi:hypothetical protein
MRSTGRASLVKKCRWCEKRVGVLEFRSSGVREFGSSGVREFRSSGVQEFRSSGVLEWTERVRLGETDRRGGRRMGVLARAETCRRVDVSA